MEHKLSATTSAVKQTSVPAEIIPLLQGTLWGTPGKTLYRHLQTASKIFDIRQPYFFMLKRIETVICTVCLAWRSVGLDSQTGINSFYIRYFVANPMFSSKGKRGKKLSPSQPNGTIKRFMEDVFSSGATIKSPTEGDTKSLFYAYVESENEQSMHLCQHYGFRAVRSMVTLPFSRFAPRAHHQVRVALPHEYDSLRQKVAQQYSSHSFVCLEHLFYKDNYYVAEHNGRIIAGLQANPTQWEIRHLPGISGKILLLLLPYIPYLSRLINPKKFHYSAIEGIFCDEGCEWAFDALLETVIAQQNCHSALIWLDSGCPVLAMLRKHCRLGLMDRINSGGGAEIIVRGQGLSSDEWLWLEHTPAYISCFDLT